VIAFLVSEAFRDLRRAGGIAASAVALITLALAAVGAFWLASSNVGGAITQWRDRVRIAVYLKREPAPAEAAALVERVEAIPGVAAVRYVGKTEALDALRRALGKDASLVDQLPSNPLPVSLEVTPAASAVTPEDARALHARLAELPEVEEIAGTVDWVERLAHWRRLLTTLGLGVGAVLALAAILTVTTATTLVLHARRAETEIMRLVGASETVIRVPLLLQGMIQGLVGAGIALGILVAAHVALAPRIEPLLQLTLGLPRVTFLSGVAAGALVGAGVLLGGLGGWLAKGRPAS
jgi:cell division transport system permease protein